MNINQIDLELMFEVETGKDWYRTPTHIYTKWLEDKLTEQLVKNSANIPDPKEWISNAVELLAMAHALVGNPGTNISGSTDMACAEWQQKYTTWTNLNEVTP